MFQLVFSCTAAHFNGTKVPQNFMLFDCQPGSQNGNKAAVFYK